MGVARRAAGGAARRSCTRVILDFSLKDFLLTFMSIIFEAMPFIVIGAIVSGAMEELLPQQFFQKILPKNRLLAIMGSSFMGFLLPMCECGIVPVMRRLLSKGVPASCAITYMLSAPIINPIVLSSTSLAFWNSYDLFGMPGLKMVLLRGGAAFITAVTVGLVIERLDRRGVRLLRESGSRLRLVESDESNRLIRDDLAHDHAHHHDHQHDENCGHEHGGCDHDHAGHDHAHGADPAHHHDHDHHDHDRSAHDHGVGSKSLLDRLTAIADIAMGDFLDIAAFLIIGAALAALVRTSLSTDRLEDLAAHQSLSILGMMGLAVALSLCSEADAFVAAQLISLSTGAKLAFLTLGPMFDIKLYIMYSWVFSRRTIWTIIPILFAVIFFIGWLTNAIPEIGSSSTLTN